MIYKCRNCASAVTYDPARKGMYCKYCDKYYSVDEVSEIYDADEGTENLENL